MEHSALVQLTRAASILSPILPAMLFRLELKNKELQKFCLYEPSLQAPCICQNWIWSKVLLCCWLSIHIHITIIVKLDQLLWWKRNIISYTYVVQDSGSCNYLRCFLWTLVQNSVPEETPPPTSSCAAG